jgi:hypothetical protein
MVPYRIKGRLFIFYQYLLYWLSVKEVIKKRKLKKVLKGDFYAGR